MDFLGELHHAAQPGNSRQARPRQEERADPDHAPQARKDDQQLQKDIELADLHETGNAIGREDHRNHRAQQEERQRQFDAGQPQLLSGKKQRHHREPQQDLRNGNR